MKIIFEVAEEHKIPISIIAATNMSKLSDVDEIEMVYLESGISAVIEKGVISPILGMKKVKVVACGVAMKERNITQDDLVPGVVSVPASFVEIARKQSEGWIYLNL
ncbi:MAG: DsrE family protein [Thermoplasmatales archaeon]|nr:DsrE family protein [Thermoplasmatales archaeon]MCW6169595.1 DsrE family protein [Thermoplasmatales archaeon]